MNPWSGAWKIWINKQKHVKCQQALNYECLTHVQGWRIGSKSGGGGGGGVGGDSDL